MSDVECCSEATKNIRGVARICPWGGLKYRFRNFGKCNLGEYPLSLQGSGHFPKVPKWVCASQQSHDFGMLSFTPKLGLSCCVSICLLLLDVWVKP